MHVNENYRNGSKNSKTPRIALQEQSIRLYVIWANDLRNAFFTILPVLLPLFRIVLAIWTLRAN